MHRSNAFLITAALLCALPIGCDTRTPSQPAVGAGAPAAIATVAALPAGLVTKGPAEGTPVTQCKKGAVQGESVTVVGRIGGSRSPFNAKRAVFSIVDASLKACNDMDDDHCKTPWDYCCEDRDSLMGATATIEIVGADGAPLPFSVAGLSGLDPLATIAVTGVVTEKNDAGVMVVRAERIQVR